MTNLTRHAGPDPASGIPTRRVQLLAWLSIIIGLTVLCVPSLVDLFTGIWSSDEQMHGSIVPCISEPLHIIGLDAAVQ